jgi:hypothetical protein
MDSSEHHGGPPFHGIVYGNIVHSVCLAGMVVAIIGTMLCVVGVSCFAENELVLRALWSGKTSAEIWTVATGQPVQGHWYLGKLGTSDGIAMLGMAICCTAAVFGIWGACLAMLIGRRKERKLFLILTVIVGTILILSLLGVVSG